MKDPKTLTPQQRALVEGCLSCVHWTIRRYIHVHEEICGLGYDDLYQEGCVALCGAAASFDEGAGAQFHSYAISVVRNHLIDYCRRIQAERSHSPCVPLEEGAGALTRDDTSARLGDIYTAQVLEYGKRTYSGVARLGVEALELKIRGYTGADIAKMYGVKANHVGAWIARAAKKLKNDAVLVENGLPDP